MLGNPAKPWRKLVLYSLDKVNIYKIVLIYVDFKYIDKILVLIKKWMQRKNARMHIVR